MNILHIKFKKNFPYTFILDRDEEAKKYLMY